MWWLCRWGCGDCRVSRNRCQTFCRARSRSIIGMGVLLAREVPKHEFLRNISAWFPSRFNFSGPQDEEFQCFVSFPTVLKQTGHKPCIAVEVFRCNVCRGRSVPMDFCFGDCCGRRCDAVNCDVLDEGACWITVVRALYGTSVIFVSLDVSFAG